MNSEITVTSPLLPPLEELMPYLQKIWDNKWITNNGSFHQQLEAALGEYLGVEHLSLFTNGTLPLMTALQALGLKGEVITTPYTFVATSHSIWWNGLTPVFADVDPATGCLDPEKVEAAVTDRTCAIMPVHVYGNVCDTEALQAIADRHNLKIIYDAAHAFATRRKGKSVLKAGDLSTLSFHATKTYNTVEGGALISPTAEMKKKIDTLKNFGFVSEVNVVDVGINAKMDEIRSAYGLINLQHVDSAIAARKAVSDTYRRELGDIEGLSFFAEDPDVDYNYSYFPVFIDEKSYGMCRDALYDRMRERGVLGRRYFYPLVTDFEPYRHLESARAENLPNAVKMAGEVICLPLHHALGQNDVERVIESVKHPSK